MHLSDLILFFFGVVVCLYLPGRYVYTRIISGDADLFSHAVSTFFGVILFVTLGLACGFLQIRWVMYGYLPFSLWLVLRHGRRLFGIAPAAKRLPETALLALCVVLFSVMVVASGWVTDRGFLFYGANGGDGLWHVSLINELMHAFPPQHPGFAGVDLKGYHFFYDFWLAEFSRLTGVSPLALVFHLVPPTMALLWVFAVFHIALIWFNNRTAALVSVFFSVFGGSFAYVVPLFTGQRLSLDDGLGITQPLTSLVNPQYAISVLCVLFSLYAIMRYETSRNRAWLLVVGMTAALATGFKAYAGMILLGGLAVAGSYEGIRNHRWWIFLTAGIAGVTGWLLFSRFNQGFGFLLYQPLWPPHRVMQASLAFTGWELRRQTYEALGSWRGLVRLEAEAMAIFVFGNLGTRFAGLIAFALRGKKFVRARPLSWVLWAAMLGVSFVIPMFFIQPTGGPFNMIQMFWYFLVLLSLPVGAGMVFLWEYVAGKLKAAAWALAAVLFVLTVPSALEKIQVYATGLQSHYPPRQVEVLTALASFGRYTDTTVEFPDIIYNEARELRSWLDGISGPFVMSLGVKRSFLSNEVAGFPYLPQDDRLADVARMLVPQKLCTDPVQSKACISSLVDTSRLLREKQIRYIIAPIERTWVSRVPGVFRVWGSRTYAIYEVLPL